MTDDTYQGWTNRETWALMLHVDNDQGLYTEFRELVTDAADPEDTVRDRVEELFSRDYWADMGMDMPEALDRMRSEVGSLWRVNWQEVVAALLED